MRNSLFSLPGRSRVAAWWAATALLLLPGAAQTSPSTQATVYRDPFGVPHIEAESEPVAWYARGFEEARDGLLLLQVSAKRVRGQAVKYLSDRPNFPAIENRLLTARTARNRRTGRR